MRYNSLIFNLPSGILLKAPNTLIFNIIIYIDVFMSSILIKNVKKK